MACGIGSTWAALRTPTTRFIATRSYVSTGFMLMKQLPPRLKIDENELEENFLKGSGPGGQKINKTSSAVQLKHLPTGLVIKSQETRSRSQNRKIARTILAEKLEEMEKGDKSRTAIKADIKKKKKASANKKAKRKYKALAEERSDDADDDGGDLEVTDDPQIEEVRK